MVYSVEIGKNIVLFRTIKGMTQEALAFYAGVSISRLRDIEHGVANPSIDILESISLAFGIALPVLFLFSLDEKEILDMIRKARHHMSQSQAVPI